MRASWTRDEVILGLDVLFSQNCEKLYKSNPTIIELSELLNRLPIIRQNDKYESFRNVAGLSSMLRKFWLGLTNRNQKFMVGELFYVVYSEYKDNLNELHKIAQAIRRCESLVISIPFGDKAESEGFPEGAILSHVHRHIEARFAEQCTDILAECMVCRLRPGGIYADMGSSTILGKHLLIAPTELDPGAKYGTNDFVTVCPNCHRALHVIRPWRGRQNYENILI